MSQLINFRHSWNHVIGLPTVQSLMKEAKHVDIDSDMEVTTKQDKNSYMIRDGVRERHSFKGIITGLALSADYYVLLPSASDDDTIKLWSFESRQLLASFDVHAP
ncbi:hypothetical protein P692DRAFT_20872094 [Suillus brevipes Sb2]|nr:hypothetical protein P692DRAFT_20872094 [Suillus brevipes Sb2]